MPRLTRLVRPPIWEAVKYRLDANFVQTNVISLTNDFISDRYDKKPA